MSEKIRVTHFYTSENAIGGPTTYINIINSSEFLKREYIFNTCYQNKKMHKLNFRDIKRIVSEIKKYKTDILHVHGLQGEGMIGVLCGKLAGCKKILVTVHGMQHDSFNVGKIKKLVYKNLIERWTLRHADAVFCVCASAEKNPYIYKNAKRLLPFLHNCVPQLPGYDRIAGRKQFGFSDNDIVFVSVGRVTEGKGAYVLRDIILQDKNDNHKFLIVGDGNALDPVKASLSDEVVKGKALFTGAVNDVGKYLSLSDVYMSTSYKENLSISLLEAGYYGLPSIVTDVGGNGEIIQNGYNGFLFSSMDIDGFFACVEQLKKDGMHLCGSHAKENIDMKFSLTVFEEGLSKIYQMLC